MTRICRIPPENASSGILFRKSFFRGGGIGFVPGSNIKRVPSLSLRDLKGSFSAPIPISEFTWKFCQLGRKNHDSQRCDRILRFFLRPEIGQLSPHFGVISLLHYTENLEKMEQNPLGKKKKWRWRPEMADFCPLSCWRVAKGSSISWVAKLKGDKHSECTPSNGWSRSYREVKLLLSARKWMVAKLQGDKSAYPWISGPLCVSWSRKTAIFN